MCSGILFKDSGTGSTIILSYHFVSMTDAESRAADPQTNHSCDYERAISWEVSRLFCAV